METKPSMLLITSTWGDPPKPTFRMIPADLMCPYQECIFDPGSKVLAVISKVSMEKYMMTPKLDDNGDIQVIKGKARPGGKSYKEERRLMQSYSEYYIENPDEIASFVERFSINFSDKWSDKIAELIYKKEVPPGEITLASAKMEAVKEE